MFIAWTNSSSSDRRARLLPYLATETRPIEHRFRRELRLPAGRCRPLPRNVCSAPRNSRLHAASWIAWSPLYLTVSALRPQLRLPSTRDTVSVPSSRPRCFRATVLAGVYFHVQLCQYHVYRSSTRSRKAFVLNQLFFFHCQFRATPSRVMCTPWDLQLAR